MGSPKEASEHVDGSQSLDIPATSRQHGNKRWPTIQQMMDMLASLFNTDRAILVPMPTADPRDPLNLPGWRKVTAIAAICCFGAMAAAAELILGAMLPVFVFLYAGLDPKLLTKVHLPAGTNSLTLLAAFPGPPIWHIYLLGSAPILVIGVANFFLVPLAVAAGRRTVLLTTGAVAIAGCVGSGFSTSFGVHLACRCIQALGAGTVESLIPFILQDIVFQHQRNAAVSVVFATQGLIIAVLGIASPYVIGHASWRVLYFATAGAGLVFWVAIFIFLPETKFARSEEEQRGCPASPLPPGRNRPAMHGRPRRWADDLRLVTGRPEWRSGVDAVWDSLRTFFYPHLFFITMLNSAVIALAVAAGYTAAPQLLAEPWAWPFYHLGFCLFPVILAACASFVLSGWGADLVANWVAGRKGTRTPEVQLLNLIFPCLVGLVGCILFGVSGDNPEKYHWIIFLMGLACITFSFLATNTIGIVYVLESNPQLAGPSLVNIASFRCLLAFALSFRVSEWVADFGYLKTFIIYACILGAFTLFIPIVYIWGAKWRQRFPS
ncbi:Major facilitator superfamily domain, general substrate transporter [Cordyceps fumosorosea ARSEF 2679]|uniref:Major facilitator superfamily domain, general substrate transporter n=1 Tax=Cordyceps fumosorosea (strain ARSEF 2679) TaxID=1081104 RepID=A0A167LH07_CORFA|nr:Major facilitator superfamily domain, general substrate transporter [Cordyceps fumosorosea ARSEF 2679]OAA53081.1 Major facilitator superfamily domain, general substrate transporter [Cordyceps fumosorosea ARSEF 2679]